MGRAESKRQQSLLGRDPPKDCRKIEARDFFANIGVPTCGRRPVWEGGGYPRMQVYCQAAPTPPGQGVPGAAGHWHGTQCHAGTCPGLARGQRDIGTGNLGNTGNMPGNVQESLDLLRGTCPDDGTLLPAAQPPRNPPSKRTVKNRDFPMSSDTNWGNKCSTRPAGRSMPAGAARRSTGNPKSAHGTPPRIHGTSTAHARHMHGTPHGTCTALVRHTHST
eukprot:gene22911-biopygen10299